MAKSFPFFDIKQKLCPKLKKLRHGSLQINIIYTITKLQSWGYDSKLEILIQKIKVKNRIYINIF